MYWRTIFHETSLDLKPSLGLEFGITKCHSQHPSWNKSIKRQQYPIPSGLLPAISIHAPIHRTCKWLMRCIHLWNYHTDKHTHDNQWNYTGHTDCTHVLWGACTIVFTVNEKSTYTHTIEWMKFVHTETSADDCIFCFIFRTVRLYHHTQFGL